MTPAERIEDLEGQLAWYKSELGLSVKASRILAVNRATGLPPNACRLLLGLADVYPRVLTHEQAFETMNHLDASEAASMMGTYRYMISQKLGKGVLNVARGVGTGLTAEGKATVGRLEAVDL